MATLKKSTVTHKVATPAAKTAAVKTAVKQVEKAAAKTEQLAKVAVKTAVNAAAPVKTTLKVVPKKPVSAHDQIVQKVGKDLQAKGHHITAGKAVEKGLVKANPPAKKSSGKPSTPKLPTGSRERMTQVLDKIESRAPAVLHSNLGLRRTVVEDHSPKGAPVQTAQPALASGVPALAAQESASVTPSTATAAAPAPASVLPGEDRSTPQATLSTAQVQTPRFAHGIAALAAEGSGTTLPFSQNRELPAAVQRTVDGHGPSGSPFITKPSAPQPAPLTNPGLLERRFEVYNDGLGSYRWRLVHASTGMVLALSKEGYGTPTAACEAAETEARLYRPGTSTVIRLNYTPR